MYGKEGEPVRRRSHSPTAQRTVFDNTLRQGCTLPIQRSLIDWRYYLQGRDFGALENEWSRTVIAEDID
ncbi:hypothetical protein PG993_007970 [Apiospora rasikravindrae]|uniref:Uncharacterized protein n=1 Tax=Apiospora rasikravindrae TaxID=990691 RepID=A0ABR1T0V2_9PEZI